MSKRKIVKIDEDKCNGCGLCIPNCREGAIKVIDGKARLISDVFCDGLGACLGHCPQGAITIEERDAVPFDEKAAMEHAAKPKARGLCGCPSSKVMSLNPRKEKGQSQSRKNYGSGTVPSQLSNWPVQIKLVPTNAPYLKGADILVAADCVPFAYPEFHEKLLGGKILLVGCPKLDDIELYKEKITEILKNNDVKSITYARMEVPCCSGLVGAIQEAIKVSDKKIPFTELVISIKGERIK